MHLFRGHGSSSPSLSLYELKPSLLLVLVFAVSPLADALFLLSRYYLVQVSIHPFIAPPPALVQVTARVSADHS